MGITYRLPLGLILPKPIKGQAILLIRDDGIGDLIYNTAYTAGILTALGYDVYTVVKEAFSETARLFLPAEKIITFDNTLYRNNLNYRFTFLSFLRKVGVDIALGSVIASSVNCDILRYSGAKEKWGYVRSPALRNKINYRGIKSVNSAYNLTDGKFVSTLAHEAALVSAAFPKIQMPDITPPKIVHKPEKPKELQNRYIVYLPEAGNMRRCCPQEKLLPVLTDIAADLTVVVLGSRKFEFENDKIINLTGRTSLKEAISIVSNASAFIGNETG
jgi:ADP-heptose:LPS heptosyltransferase